MVPRLVTFLLSENDEPNTFKLLAFLDYNRCLRKPKAPYELLPDPDSPTAANPRYSILQ